MQPVEALAAALSARQVEHKLLLDGERRPIGVRVYVARRRHPRGFVPGTHIPVSGTAWAVEAEWYGAEDGWSLSRVVRDGPDDHFDNLPGATTIEELVDTILEEVR